MPSTATFQQISTNRVTISGLTEANRVAGSYRLDFDALGLVGSGGPFDAKGSTTWIIDLTPPRAIDVIDVSPDPRTGDKKAVSKIDIVFSELIDLTSLTSSDFSLTRDGGANLIDSSITISPLSGNSVRVSNLAPLTNRGGRYVFSVDGQYQDLAGNVGTAVQRDEWLSNDAPLIALGGVMVFPEDSAPRPIAAGGFVTDADTPALNGGRLTISIANPTSNNQLGILNRPQSITQITVAGKSVMYQRVEIGVFSGGVDGAPLIVDLNQRATPAAVQALLRSIHYQYNGEIFRASYQTISVSLTDGEGGTSKVETKQVLRQPVNDAPKLTVANSQLAYTLNGPAIGIASTAIVKDVDSSDFYNGSVIARFVSGKDGTERLSVSGDYSILNSELRYKGTLIGIVNSDGQNGRSLSMRLNAAATLGIVQGLARSLTFSTANSTSKAQRTLEFFVQDGGSGGQSEIAKIVINPI